MRKNKIQPINSVENDDVDDEEQDDAGRRPNPSRETQFSGANGDREKTNFAGSTDHEQDSLPYPVDDHTLLQIEVMTIHTAVNAIGTQ